MWTGSSVQQVEGNYRVIVMGGDVQRRQSVLAFNVWINALRVEESNHFVMSVLGCDVQWRETSL